MANKVLIKDLVSTDFITIEPGESFAEIRRKLAERKRFVAIQRGKNVHVQTRERILDVLKQVQNARTFNLAMQNITVQAAVYRATDIVTVTAGRAFATMKGPNLSGVHLETRKITARVPAKKARVNKIGGDIVKIRTSGPSLNLGNNPMIKIVKGGGKATGTGNTKAMVGGGAPVTPPTRKGGGKATGTGNTKAMVGGGAPVTPPTRKGGGKKGGNSGGTGGGGKGPGNGNIPPDQPGKPDSTPEVDKVAYYLNAEYKDEAVVRKKMKIRINVSKDHDSKAHLAAMVEERVPITIILSLLSGFELQSPQTRDIIPGGAKEQAECSFDIMPVTPGTGKLSILAFQKGQPLGTIEIAIDIAADAKSSTGKQTREKLKSARSTSPDLMFLISEQKTGDDTYIHFMINAADAGLKIYYKSYGPVKIPLDPVAYFNDLFTDIEGFNKGIFKDGKVPVSEMERIGADIFDQLIPDELKLLLWKVKDKIKTIMISSTEPYIPWEICRLSGTENGRTVEYGFLAEKYEVTRWISNKGFPEPVLRIPNWAVVVPENTGLKHAKLELKFLEKLAGKKFKFTALNANYTEVKNAFQSGEYSLWHFSGHGSSQNSTNPDKAVMVLNKDGKFMPNYISGAVKDLGLAQPLVFLNACQIGKGGVGLTGIGGWAAKFLEAGASVFIGAYWSILDDSAFEFAKEFYSSLIKNKLTIGEAALRARTKIKKNGDPAWLAYVVYADPYAKIA